jgi:predicted dehydrogenase
MSGSTVRVGVVGTTWYAETHLRNLQSHPRAEVTAISGRDRAKAGDVAARYGIPLVFGSYSDMIASGQLDAIVIIAPDELHLPITLEALDAGLHVLCEKPLATTAADAELMYRTAEARGLTHMSFFALRTSIHHRYLRALVDEGYLGSIYTAQLHLSHGFFRGPGYQWRFDSRRGTGALGDLGCYLIDQARWYVGDITAVAADLRSFVDRPAPDGADYVPANDSAVLAVRFGNGAHGTISANVVAHQAQGRQRNTIALQGEGGTLELDHTFAGATLRGARADEDQLAEIPIPAEFWAGVDPSDPGAASRSHSVGDRAFVDAILAGTPVEPSFHDGWQVQRVIEAAFSADASRGWCAVEQHEEARR